MEKAFKIKSVPKDIEEFIKKFDEIKNKMIRDRVELLDHNLATFLKVKMAEDNSLQNVHNIWKEFEISISIINAFRK
jgi:hypothetical protein